MKVTIETRADARVRETWAATVPDGWTDEQIAAAFEANEFGPLTEMRVEHVSDEVDDERERTIHAIRREP